MAELDILEGEQKKWIPYDKDTEVLVRFVSKIERDELQRKAGRAARNPGVDYTRVFYKLYSKECIFGWRKNDNHDHPGFTLKGKPFPFNEKNLDFLVTNSDKFATFVDTVPRDPSWFRDEDDIPEAGDVHEDEEEASKNASQPTSEAGPTTQG